MVGGIAGCALTAFVLTQIVLSRKASDVETEAAAA
jgi:DHA1 family bicyclomycin/chloramphenicol resistance-like MFS transporter